MHTSGPWFRMSHVSYSEVLDPQEAVKGLSGKNIVVIFLVCFVANFQMKVFLDITYHTAATGYICSVEDTDGLHDNDIKEMLNLLTVSELRDILGNLKVCNNGHYYKNLVPF